MIIQFGYLNTGGNSGALKVIKPIACNFTRSIIATVYHTSSSGNGFSGCYAYNANTTEFYLVKDFTQTNKGTGIFWLLMGY